MILTSYHPLSSTTAKTKRPPPLISCTLLPQDFMTCDDLLDLKGNITAKEEIGYGCLKFGGQKFHEVEFTSTRCTALPGIECFGNRTFIKDGFPCIKYTEHYFLTTLLFSILLGIVGVDRFCLGHVGAFVGKLISLGGLGVWWIIDIILLITGQLTPEDGSNWIPQV